MRYVLTCLLWLFLPTLVLAEGEEVDVELVLAVDVSRSMMPWELELQRRGYAEALASDVVWAAIQKGLLQRIAVTYVEWAGPQGKRIVVPWTIIEKRADAQAIADQIVTHFDGGLRRTSISSAIGYAAQLIEENDLYGLRRVIDISGDGPNNAGLEVTVARDRVVATGITINGLPLMTYDANGPMARWGIPDLDVYYQNCVIGGPGAFVIPVTDWAHFADAVKRKLVLEIAAPSARIWRVQAQGAYNCRVGEDLWERNRGIYSLP